MKSSTTKISIITPSYNQGRFLEDTLRSVIGQELGHFTLQYIIQDNCSTDITSEVLARYNGLENTHVRIQSDAGQADALNRGFRYSDGSILGWVNSDDVLLPGALEAVSQTFEENPDVDVVYGEACFIDESGVMLSKYPTTNFDANLFLGTCFLSQPSVFFRRSIFAKVGGLKANLHYCLDYNLWIKFYLAKASFYYLEKPLSATRIYGETKTASGGMKFVDEILQMFRDELGYIPECWRLYEKYSKEECRNPGNNLVNFIKALTKFLLANPGAFPQVLPYVAHLLKHNLKKKFTTSGAPFSMHYSKLGNKI